MSYGADRGGRGLSSNAGPGGYRRIASRESSDPLLPIHNGPQASKPPLPGAAPQLKPKSDVKLLPQR